MDSIKDFFSDNPEFSLFCCLAIGYLFGKVRFGPIKLGGICGTLLAAIVIGQADVVIHDDVKNIAFVLFIFALGFTGGPQFFANLNRRGLRVGLLSGIEVVTILGLGAAFTALFNLDRGTAAGIVAGGATESAMVGTATESLGKLDASSADISRWQANVATGYTVSYLFGLITLVIFTSQIAPMILKINLPDEARKLWERLGGVDSDPGKAPALPALVGRVYEVGPAAGHRVAQVEHELNDGATIERIRRGDADVDVSPDVELAAGDHVLVLGRRAAVVPAEQVIGAEQALTEGMNVTTDTIDVVFTSSEVDHGTLAELTERLGEETRHGVYLDRITRMEREIPALPNTDLHHGDVIRVTGAPKDVDRVSQRIGFPIKPSDATDLIVLGFGIAAGIIIGKATLRVADIPLSLGMGGGSLLVGLVLGYARAKHPTFGSLPGPAAQILKDFGLATFIAVVGLGVGDQASDLFERYGWRLPVMGLLMVLVPASISLFVGKRFLNLDAPTHIGAIAGQQCSTPAITQVMATAGNSTPLTGYTITYAISNVLLPLVGPIIVGIAGSLN